MKVKIFSGSSYRHEDLKGLENKINEWLKENEGIEIIEIKQSLAGHSYGESYKSYLITIIYKER